MTIGYSLTTHYAGQGLLDSFSFFTGSDPNHGFVDYQSKEDAITKNLVSVGRDYNNVRLGVDSNITYSVGDKGRPSVRLTSHDAFTHGLFIADIYHMPASTCGTWPAFWAFNNQQNGSDWPRGGELEIIEGANTAQRNLFSAHTTTGCRSPHARFTGEQGRADCSPTPDNLGCSYASPPSDNTSYGDAFNAEGGGVYALEWDSEDLKLWHFPRSEIPDNVVYAHVVGPDPKSWGPPQAIFGGSSCSPDHYFFNLSLVLNINFCGDYAGNIWGKSDQCDRLAPTCEEFVAGNPSSFQGAYWDINFIDVYQMGPLSDTTIPPVSANITSSKTPSATSATAAPSRVIPTRTRTITLSSVSPTETGGLKGTRTINDHTLLGCFRSSVGQHAFSQVASAPNMDHEACLVRCTGRKYAGVHDNVCYCSDTLGEAAAVETEKCNIPCPGNGHQVCGGHADIAEKRGSLTLTANSGILDDSSAPSPQSHRRSTSANVLLTVSRNLANEPAPPAAPAMGKSPLPTVLTTAVTVTYTTICATNRATLVESEYRTTVTYEECGCTKAKPSHASTTIPPSLAAVPMTTRTETCQACGLHSESTVTLTVPKAVLTSEVVTAVAVQTVVPVSSNNTTLANGTAAFTFTPGTPPTPRPSISNATPVAGAAASRGRTAAVVQTLGWGVALWFGFFGAMLIM